MTDNPTQSIGERIEKVADITHALRWGWSVRDMDNLEKNLRAIAQDTTTDSARLALLEKERDNADHCFKQMEERADALEAENAVLRSKIEERMMHHIERRKQAEAEGNGLAQSHHSEMIFQISLIAEALSVPNERASRMLAVIEAAKKVHEEWSQEITREGDLSPRNAFMQLGSALATLTGDQ